MSQKFKRSLPAASRRLLVLVGELSHRMGCRTYLVGGIVRDIALGYPDTDLDIVVEGDAGRVARRLADTIGASFKKPTEFGTCKVESETFGLIDFATARREIYSHPGALPQVEQSGITEDLVRRDFTINAMAICLNPDAYGRLLDPCGGLPDLVKGRLRVMHERSFIDDPTRILRGVRFAARYGLRFERRTARLLRDCLDAGAMESISGKRAYRELRLICAEASALRGLRMLETHGILRSTLGSAQNSSRRAVVWRKLPRAIEAIEHLAGSDFAAGWLCWFAPLCAGVSSSRAERLASHLNLPRDVREVCLWVSRDSRRVAARLTSLGRQHPYRVTAILKPVPPEGLVYLYAISPAPVRDLISLYLKTWRHVVPSVTGGEIASMGIGEGPLVGKILSDILRLRLAGRLSTRNDELAYVRERIRQHAKA